MMRGRLNKFEWDCEAQKSTVLVLFTIEHLRFKLDNLVTSGVLCFV